MRPKASRRRDEQLLACNRSPMNRDERRRPTRTVWAKDARTGEAARPQTVTGPPGDGTEELKQDPYRDEGGEG